MTVARKTTAKTIRQKNSDWSDVKLANHIYFDRKMVWTIIKLWWQKKPFRFVLSCKIKGDAYITAVQVEIGEKVF
jgi:hypothetical protein